MATPTFNNTIVARAAAALWGVKLGAATTASVLQQAAFQSGGLNSVINDAFNASYGSATDASVAAAVVANLGITGANAAGAEAAVAAALAAAPAGTKGSTVANLVNVFSTLTSDPLWGAAATAFNAQVASAVTYAQTPGTSDALLSDVSTVTPSFNLTTGLDFLSGTAGNDSFAARIIDNSNTLQSGDVVSGGAGTDTLLADMGSSQSFAVTPETTGIETFMIRAQSRATDTGDNNVALEGRVNIDAERTVGVNRWESNNSRADVIVEDVRILSTQITKDITVAMVSTDPGHVDYALYFDQHSLRSNSNTASVLNIELMDTRSADAGKDPLLESPFNGFQFTLGGTLIKLQSDAIDAATTYAALLAAVQAAVAANPLLANITVGITGTFTAIDTISGRPQVGQTITLSSSSGDTLATGAFLTKDGTVPASSGLHTVQNTTATTSQDLVTVKVILDDVGRGSNGGDLVIGGLSVGETSSSKGVERFDVTVERNSKLEIMSSTANTLKEVVLVNGTNTNAAGNGTLSVLGFSGTDDFSNQEHPGVSEAHHSSFGFTDVRLIDGSALKGAFSFDAQITENSFAKYINTVDTQPDPAGDNTSNTGKKVQQVADFIYSGGSAADSISVQIDGSVVASNSNVQTGREDFTFVVNGNAGNDRITTRIINTGNNGGDQFWYSHQKENANVTINAGDGDDTVNTPGAGDIVINLGTGNDTSYNDNTGAEKATWVFNTAFQSADAALAALPGVLELGDLRSDTNDTNLLYKGNMTVTFKGLVGKAVIGSTATFRTTDLHINQAIKAAINNDPVLSKLLVASDGPFASLVVTSLIDGDRVAGDLAVVVTLPTVEQLTSTEITALAAAYSPAGGPALAATYAAVTGAMTTTDVAANYASTFGQILAADVDGLDSVTTSDNTTTGAAGRDVIVLGTTIGADTLNSSNEVVVYSGAADTAITDYILNFDVAGPGIDQLDLTAWNGVGAQFGVAIDTNKSITVAVADASNQGATEAASQTLIAGLYANDATASSHVYIVFDAATGNVGKVYQVVDTTSVAVGDVTATLMGSIDLADVAWAALTADNFV